MLIDPDRYRHHLDAFDMTEEAKLDFMRAVWSILERFVDDAWGEAPEQYMLGTNARESGVLPGDPLHSIASDSTHQFNAAGKRQKAGRHEVPQTHKPRRKLPKRKPGRAAEGGDLRARFRSEAEDGRPRAGKLGDQVPGIREL